MKFTLLVQTSKRAEFIDITSRLQSVVSENGVQEGYIILFVGHTTAGVTINEGADPAVREDMLNILEGFVPQNRSYFHLEGNSDSHLKASLMGASETVFIENGRLFLGTWQAIYFCEFDGPRKRQITCKVFSTKEEST
ncbi:MAG: secondary thiamine-phosphate synthase enzyme YjbQ [Nitrospinota bacterium]